MKVKSFSAIVMVGVRCRKSGMLWRSTMFYARMMMVVVVPTMEEVLDAGSSVEETKSVEGEKIANLGHSIPRP